MKGFSINPHTRVIGEFDTGSESFLAAIKKAIGADRLETALLAPGVLMWIDAHGATVPGQAWWRFKGGDLPIAGSAVFTGVDRDGMPSDYVAAPSLEEVGKGIEFLLSVESRVLEALRVEHTPRGPWPRVYHELAIDKVVPLDGKVESRAEPELEDRQAMLEQGTLRQCWIVTRTDTGFVGTEYSLVPGKSLTPTGNVINAPSLDELGDEIPPDHIFFERGDNDAPEIVGTWI